jgi:hypothetical protein
MKVFYVLALLTIGAQATAQTNLSWAKQFGNSGITDGSVLQLDSAGNSYMAGVYPSDITFGNITLNASGGESSFITKFAPNGDAIWATKCRRIGGFQDKDNPEKIAIDNLGNLYVTGIYLSGATIGSISIPGNAGYFIAKLNAAGTALWIRVISSPDNINAATISIYINHSQQICMAGLYNSAITFDATHTLLNTESNTLTDAFLAKYDANGNVISAVELGTLNKKTVNTNSGYEPELFRTDIKGNLYRVIKRTFSLKKYNPDGALLLTKTLAVTGTIIFWDMTADPSGNIFLCSWFEGTVSLEGESINTQKGGFFTKLDPAGNLLWNHTEQTMQNDAYYKIKTDAIGNVYVSGANALSTTLVRLLMAKYDNNGTLIWDQSIYPRNADNTLSGEANQSNMVLAKDGGNALFMGYYQKYIRFSDDAVFTSPATTGRIVLAQYGLCNNITAPVISSNAGTAFCEGANIKLSSTPAQEYLWSNGDTTADITVTTPGDYQVISITHGECFAKSASIHIDKHPSPDQTLTKKGASLIANESNATYQWLDCSNNALLKNQTGQRFNPTVSGNYAVTITDKNGCTITSACDSVTISEAIQGEDQPGIMLYPNPAESEITLLTSRTIKSIVIFNITGQKVLETTEKQINISVLPAGTYILLAEISTGIWKGKFVKQ